MKSPFLFIALILLSFTSLAQVPQGKTNGQRPDSSKMANMPRTGKIFGIVQDGATKQPMEYVSVVVKSVRDSSLVGGAITNEKGKFTISDLPAFGRFRLEVTYIGYATIRTEAIKLSPQSPIADAGIINILLSGKSLEDINITAEKSELQNSIDKKVYNVDKNIINIGGTATDILQNIPSVNVDIDGNVALRGSNNVTVYIDGKPSGMTGGDRQAVLQQIPASAIDKIEVITNPSAKYDAEGMAGIINIVTKKGKLQGLNGNASAGLGTNNKYNASIGINSRTEFINIYGNYSFRSEDRDFNAHGFQTNMLPNRSYTIETDNSGEQHNTFHTGKAGADINIDNYNTLGLAATYSVRKEDHPEQIESIIDNTDPHILRDNSSYETNNTLDGILDCKKTFKDSKRELTASGSYSNSKRDETKNYKSNINDYGENPYQRNISDVAYTAATLQSDYVHPFSNSKLETGIKGSFRINDNDVQALIYDGQNKIYINDIRYSDHFIYDENIFAAYGLYTGKIKSFDYSAGLRAEQTLTSGDSKSTGQTINNDYFALFPSASVKYNWKGSNETQLSYSRRTNRPQIQSVNPFVDYSDSLNLRKGNPYLLPEYTHSLELSYVKTLEKLSISATVYYRHTDDVISRYRSVDTLTGVSTMQMVNLNTSDNIGLETILRYQLGKSGSIMWSTNFFQNTLNGSNVSAELQGTNNNWNTRLTANYRFTKDLSGQLSGMYGAPMKEPTRTLKGMMNSVDVGIKYDLMKGKASISLNVTDIFDTRKFQIHTDQDNFIYDGFRKRETRIATLTFAYRFGKQESTNQRKKGQKNPVQEGGGENNSGGDF